MNGETNDNVENLDELNVENAFSDLISEYFEEENNAQNLGNVNNGKVNVENAGTVLDWDSVANGQLFTNVTAEGIQNNLNNQQNNAGTLENSVKEEGMGVNNGLLYNNLEAINDINNQSQLENNATNILYNNIGEQNNPIENAYNSITMPGKIIEGINFQGKVGINGTNTINQGNTNNENGTNFKLTQANLPAKIGFWTKVRNFFITDSKIQYSVDTTRGNTGIWNKVQNFFSFGKNK